MKINSKTIWTGCGNVNGMIMGLWYPTFDIRRSAHVFGCLVIILAVTIAAQIIDDRVGKPG